MTQFNTGLLAGVSFSAPPAGNNNFTQAHVQNPYRVWKARARYVYRSGLTQRGVATPSATGQAAPSPGSTSEANLPPGVGVSGETPVGAGPRIAAAITQTNAPYMLKIVEWIAAREGAMPAIPSPQASNGNETFADYELVVDSPDLFADGNNRIYQLSGTYTYLLSTYLAPQDAKFYFPAPPSDTAPLTAVPASLFTPNQIG